MGFNTQAWQLFYVEGFLTLFGHLHLHLDHYDSFLLPSADTYLAQSHLTALNLIIQREEGKKERQIKGREGYSEGEWEKEEKELYIFDSI